MTLRTLEPITMQLRLSEPLRLSLQEKGRPSGNSVIPEISQWVAPEVIWLK